MCSLCAIARRSQSLKKQASALPTTDQLSDQLSARIIQAQATANSPKQKRDRPVLPSEPTGLHP